MKDKINFKQIGTLLRKQRQERAAGFRKGNFDAFGFILRWFLILVFLAVFVIFFSRFTGIYLSVRTNGVENTGVRLYELLSMAYTLILVFMVIGGVSQINRQLFEADDITLLTGMPVSAKTIFLAKLVSIYFGQLVISAVCVLAVNFSVVYQAPQDWWYYVMTVVMCFVLPLISLAIAAMLAMPYHAAKQFLKERFVLYFIIVTALTAVLFYVYSVVLGAVRDMLLGDTLKYFFNEPVMNFLTRFSAALYPGVWFANFMLRKELLYSGIGILIVLVVCLVLAMVVIRSLMRWVLQSRIAGSWKFMRKEKRIKPQHSPFHALMKKDFLHIFRTPAYMFSYFSVAVLMPLMVYFCMTIGSSIVTKLIGINCDLELAIFLTLLFGALTNVFCSTNISREGAMFYSLKAYPLSYRSVFFSKVLLCMIVSVLSQFISAVLLLGTGYVVWWAAGFIFLGGVICSFAQICFATRYDFNHAKFSTEEDGEIKESGNTVSVIIVLGMVVSFLVGGSVLLLRLIFSLRLVEGLGYLTYLIVGVVSMCAAVLAFYYLMRKLGKKYYEFSGGGQL